MCQKREVKSLILKLLDDKTSYEDLVHLVQITSSIASTYLQVYYPSFLHICAQNGLTKEDLAEDSILELFARDERGEFFYLQNFSESLDFPLDQTGEEQVYYAYESFVQTVAIRQLVKTHAKIDPPSAKIYRNIKDCVRQNNSITLKKDFRGYVIQPSGDPRNHLPEFPEEELKKRIADQAPSTKNIPQMLTVLMDILQKQSTYRRSFRLASTVKIFKRYYFHFGNHVPEQSQKFDFSSLAEVDHEIIKMHVRETIQQKILNTYVFSQKIDSREAHQLYGAVTDMINDWFDHETDSKTYLDYARKNLRIDESQYEERWRTKIEYLARIAREQIKTYLMNGL